MSVDEHGEQETMAIGHAGNLHQGAEVRLAAKALLPIQSCERYLGIWVLNGAEPVSTELALDVAKHSSSANAKR